MLDMDDDYSEEDDEHDGSLNRTGKSKNNKAAAGKQTQGLNNSSFFEYNSYIDNRQKYKSKYHMIIDIDELRELANNPQMVQYYTDLQNKKGGGIGYCEDHPGSKLTLYCEDDDKFICTKCIIRNRDEHYDHTIHEIKDLYGKASDDLNLHHHQNQTVNSNLQSQMEHITS